MSLFLDGTRFAEEPYSLEAELEEIIVRDAQTFFGEKSIYIDSKKRIESEALGKTIPDAFLFDFSDPDAPEFYLVEVELACHDFYRHIFPQITKFFAFFQAHTKKKLLVEKLYETITLDSELKSLFKRQLNGGELFKFLSDTIEGSQNILLVIDGNKPELPEIIDTYTDTWGKMVKVLTLRKYSDGSRRIYCLEPDFEAIEFSLQESADESLESDRVDISEDFHLDEAPANIRDIYLEIKSRVLEMEPSVVFNPQKYYISIRTNRNIAFLKLKKKKMRLIVMLPEQEIRDRITQHTVKSLSQSVQRFYNGECAEVHIYDSKHLDDIIELIGLLIERHSDALSQKSSK